MFALTSCNSIKSVFHNLTKTKQEKDLLKIKSEKIYVNLKIHTTWCKSTIMTDRQPSQVHTKNTFRPSQNVNYVLRCTKLAAGAKSQISFYFYMFSHDKITTLHHNRICLPASQLHISGIFGICATIFRKCCDISTNSQNTWNTSNSQISNTFYVSWPHLKRGVKNQIFFSLLLPKQPEIWGKVPFVVQKNTKRACERILLYATKREK